MPATWKESLHGALELPRWRVLNSNSELRQLEQPVAAGGTKLGRQEERRGLQRPL